MLTLFCDCMVDIEIAALVLTGLGLMASIIYYANILQNATKTQKVQLETRQAQLFMQIYRDICTPEWWRILGETTAREYVDYDKSEEEFGKEANMVAWSEGSSLFAFFEGLGVLVHRKLIDPNLVDDLLSGPIIRYWESSKPYIVERRIRQNHPPIGEWIEYLYSQIKPIFDKQHPELAN
jgi:hypothetical protein